MQYILGLAIVLLLSIGNFIPLPNGDSFSIAIRTLILLVSFFLLISYSKLWALKKSILLYLIVTSIIFLISSLYSQDIIYAFEKYLSISWWLVVAIGLTQIQINKYGIVVFLKTLTSCGLLVLLLTVFYKFNYGFWDRQVRFFINGPIVFGWLMGFYFFVSLYCFNITKKKSYLLISFFFVLALLWSESKGPLVSLVLSLMLYLLYSKKILFKLLMSLSVFIIAIYINQFVLLLNSLFVNTRFEAILRILSGSLEEKDAGSVDIRGSMIKESYILFTDNLWTGIGLGNYKFNTIYGFDYPHNIHLEIFLECGIIVGFIYIFFIIINFLRAPLIIKALMLFFILSGAFSGDITYLRLLIYCIFVSIVFRLEFNKISVSRGIYQ